MQPCPEEPFAMHLSDAGMRAVSDGTAVGEAGGREAGRSDFEQYQLVERTTLKQGSCTWDTGYYASRQVHNWGKSRRDRRDSERNDKLLR